MASTLTSTNEASKALLDTGIFEYSSIYNSSIPGWHVLHIIGSPYHVLVSLDWYGVIIFNDEMKPSPPTSRFPCSFRENEAEGARYDIPLVEVIENLPEDVGVEILFHMDVFDRPRLSGLNIKF